MTREELNNLTSAIVTLREGATDEQALDAIGVYALWKPGIDYAINDRRRWKDKLYRCVQAHTALPEWEPDITPALWVRISIEDWPEWIQPISAADAYNAGDKVSHNGQHWISDVDANVWEPSVYGWTLATEGGG